MTGDAGALLREAWDDLLAELARARDAIDQPERMPAPPTDRNLAEGYRYLLGFVHNAIERSFFGDPRFPFVRHALQLLNKGTIDNPDAIYFAAPIDGRESYLLRGRARAHGHWRGEPRATSGPLAPQYLIIELNHGGLAGDSGSLAELRPGVKVQTGRVDSTEIEVDQDGSFEILLAPERPAGHTGNFVCSKRRTKLSHPDQTDGSNDRHAEWLSGRQLFYDWAREEPVPLTLERIGSDREVPGPLTPDRAAAQLRELGALVRGQMHFWNEFNTVLLETYGKRGGPLGKDREENFMPRNAFNRTNAAGRETGGGQSTNLYAGGVFELEPDEALVVSCRAPVEPQYCGFGAANLWGESLDFANHQSSLNGFEAEPDADGTTRIVIAHRDPGIPNWIDTTGHREGYMSPRWTYAQTPPPEQWPSASARLVRFDDVRSCLPSETRVVSRAERADRIRVRREHVQRRYRVF